MVITEPMVNINSILLVEKPYLSYNHGNGLGLAQFVWFGEQSDGHQESLPNARFIWHADLYHLICFPCFHKHQNCNFEMLYAFLQDNNFRKLWYPFKTCLYYL